MSHIPDMDLATLRTVNGTAPLGLKLLGLRDLLHAPEPVAWTVEGMIEHGTVGALIGPPAAGKSLAAIDMMLCMALGQAWHGRPTRKGAAIYLCGEGRRGLARRIAAWGIRHGFTLDDLGAAPMYVSPHAVALSDPASVEQIQRAVEEATSATGLDPASVTVDTLARNFGAADENSTADMSRVIGHIDLLRDALGCSMILAHHTGHGDASRGRGSSALRGALDFEYTVTQSQPGAIEIAHAKLRDGEPPPRLAFTIESVRLPWADEDGAPIFGPALVPTDAPAEPQPSDRQGLGDRQRRMLHLLRHLFTEHRGRLTAGGHSPAGARVELSEWRDRAIADRLISSDRRRFHDVRAGLERRGLIQVSGQFVEVTEADHE